MDCPLVAMKQRKILKGHGRKVLHFDWCPDSRHLLSGAQVLKVLISTESET